MSPHLEPLALLEEGRAALRGDASAARLSIMRPLGEDAPVALLRTIGRPAGDLVVALREGRNAVCRELGHYDRWPKPYAVEAGQWIVVCQARRALVWDAASTNGSVIVPKDFVSAALPERVPLCSPARMQIPGAILLPHPQVASDPHGLPLHEGDLLVGCYATFLFAWL